MSGTNHTKVQNKETNEMLNDLTGGHVCDTVCFCKRCDSIAGLYKIRQNNLDAIVEKYKGTCVMKENQFGEMEHDSDACRDAVQTLCSEKRHYFNSWLLFLINFDIEAFAWKRLAARVNNNRLLLDLSNEQACKTEVASEVQKLYSLRDKLANSPYLRTHSNQSIDYVETSPFSALKLLIQFK